MKRIAKFLIPLLGLAWIFFHFGCRTLSTTAGSPPSGPVNGMLYYLPIGKITIKGEFKPSSPSEKAKEKNIAGPSAPTGNPGGAGGEQPTPGAATITAGELTITLTPEVEADEKAGEYYVTPRANYIYEDEARMTVNSKQLLSTGNVTTEDKTADIVGAVASIAAQAGGLKLLEGTPTPTPPPPFYFSFHPSCYDEVEFVKEQLKARNKITFDVKPAPTRSCKLAYTNASEAMRLGEKGLIFRPATSYKIMLKYSAIDPRDGKTIRPIIDSTQQFILPDPNRLYEIEYPRMAFVKKVKEIGFTNGMLTDFRQKVPSPILGFLGIPKAVLQAIVPIPGAPPQSGSASGAGTTPPKT
jgi:hypothetical protein